ncbi:MAG: helix-turn-helix transcriptional regulator [Haloarculaceae archaeon]
MTRSWVGVLLVVFVLTASVGPAGAAGARSTMLVGTQQEFDSTEFHVTVYENGSARWAFMYKKTLNDSNRQEFEDYAERFEENDTEAYRTFRDRARALTRSGTNTTGREMTATGFEKRAYVTNLGNRGIVEMSFLWSNFAVTDADRVVVGDVFEGGLYVGPNQRFVVERGPNLTRRSADPPPDASSNDSVTWDGEHEFADNRPRVVFVTGDAAGGGEPGDGTPTDGGPADDGTGWLPWAGLFVVLLLVGGFLAWRYGLVGTSGESGPPPAAAPVGGESDQQAAADESDVESEPTPAVTDEELMSDEERVVQLLEAHGGRMKQVNIVEETGWSKSKVSMLLSDMEEDGEVSKLRIGRENVISLPGHEPEGAGSPFDDEESS